MRLNNARKMTNIFRQEADAVMRGQRWHNSQFTPPASHDKTARQVRSVSGLSRLSVACQAV